MSPVAAQMFYCKGEIQGLDSLPGKAVRTFNCAMSQMVEGAGGPPLNQKIECLALTIDGTPEPQALTTNLDSRLVEMPLRARPGSPAPQLPANAGPNFATHRRTLS